MRYPGLADVAACRQLALSLLAPAASADLWPWCAAHLHLRTGRWEPGRADLMRHWYDLACARIANLPDPADPGAHLTEQIYLILSGQIAKTTLSLAVAAWVMAEHPREIAWYGTRLKDLQRIRRRSLLPMIERSPPLARLLPASKEARDTALGADMIELGSALMYLLVGNLIDDLRSLPLPLILVEEFDQLGDDIGRQGDPIEQMQVRQRTHPHDRLLLGSTSPSTITRPGWSRLCSGSHERPLVRCPDCGGCHYLDDRLVTSATAHSLEHYPPAVIRREGLARWTCIHCGVLHPARAVRAMVRECAQAQRWVAGTWAPTDDHPDGHWTPQAEFAEHGRLLRIIPPDTTTRSGWANSLYSRDVTLDVFAADMVAKYHHGKPSQQKTWTNHEACRPWIHTVAASTTDDVRAACQDYAHGSCPVAADLVILVWDQQGNQEGRFWFPGVVRAWAKGLGSWLVWSGRANTEAERDALEDRLFPVGDQHRAADVVVMDCANPNYRQRAYLWAAEHPARRLVLRGDSRLDPGETWREVPPPDGRRAARTSRPASVREWRIHPHYWRTALHESMLGDAARLPWHLPGDPPDFYLRSLTAEEQTTKLVRVTGGGYQEMVIWEPRVTTATDESMSVRKDEHWADAEKMQLAIADILHLTDPADPATLTPTTQEPDRDDDDSATYFGSRVW